MELLHFIDPLRKILDGASAQIMKVYGDPSLFHVDRKADDSPLTAADMAANEVICDGLANLVPSFPIISEENKEIPFEERSQYEYCWLVDPLDGTKEFIRRNDEFTVNIALVRNTKVVMGCIALPVTGEHFVGILGHGSKKYANGSAEVIRCRPFQQESTGLGLVCSRSHLNEETKNYIDNFRDPTMHPRGSALKFTVLASGEADIYPRLGPTMEWDTAAAQIILEEAGGSLLEWNSRSPLGYNKQSLLNPNFIAFGDGVLTY